ncbi:MAG: hypothetical protein NDI67_00995 [Sulfuritalea sp.]|nr:hypothetical protein [Sulfuritalea sp.]
MFEPRKLRVIYRIQKPDGRQVELDNRVDENGLLEGLPDQGPDWTRLNGNRCAGCNARHRSCRAAVAIAPVVDAFKTMDSLEHVAVSVVMANYTAEVICPASKVVSSIMGLRMAASGCAKIAPFRAMALYHQPFSSLEETVIRAAGFMLLGRWAHGTLATNDPFASLIVAWDNLEEVNLRVAQALQEHGSTDAALNGLVNLDMFAKAGGLGLKRALDALKPALLAWDMARDFSLPTSIAVPEMAR